MATVLIKFTNEGQYNPSNSTITYEDGLHSRWSSVYSKLKKGDTCIFHSDSNQLYVGEYQSSILNTSVTFGNIRKTSIKLDDLLRIHLLQPETISVFKRPPGPVLKEDIDVNIIFQDASNRKFISFYAIRKGKESLYLPRLSENDRVVLIDDSDKITDLCIVENGALDSKIMGADLFQAKGKDLQEILNIHKSIQNERGLKSSNNAKSIERLIDNLAKVGFYQFKSFSEYYNAIHNKSAYNSQSPSESDGNSTKSSDDFILEEEIDFNYALNTILYGPSGTGKTYFTKNLAIQIIENKSEEEIKLAYPDREDLNRAFLKYQKEEQIGFVTFHQSFGYEDFIEGIKPLPPLSDEDKAVQYAVVDGIFKRICTEATFSLAVQAKVEPLEKVMDFSQLYDKFINNIQEGFSQGKPQELETVSGGKIIIDGVSERNNLIVKHKNSNKTYVVSKDRLTKLASEISDLQAVSNIDATFREVIGGSNSTAYWAALNAIRKLKPTSPGSIRDFSTFSYEGKKSAIEQFELKEYDAENADKFVLIIDEINRGNVAQIFGELITLIEDDKRMGQKNALKATLTYSNTAFSVPPNLYIIGTMNTADRSVEALDTALRRRFSFVKMEPKPDELPIKMIGNIDLVLMLKTINKRLEVLIDTDHTIGHAWLWDVDSLGGLKKAFKDKIIPLLQEFFYNDYEKIGLILGKDFVKQKPAKEYVHFAPFKGDSDLASSYHEKTIFTLAEMDEEITEASFLGIYTQKTDESK